MSNHVPSDSLQSAEQQELATKLKQTYEDIALSRDERTTACDFNLRELEIDTALKYIKDQDRILDVGCGLGYSLRKYASERCVEGHGIDYAENMIKIANELQGESQVPLRVSVRFQHASVLELPFPDSYFDVVTSARCLMALLDWELQKKALVEIRRVLKPGGVLVLMEGTHDGLERLNEVRAQFGLTAIEAGGRERLFTEKFHESQLIKFCADHYQLETIQRFGMYYFLTRVLHPLLVAPESPKYDAKINSIALEIARKIPDFMALGHLTAFILRKKA